MDEEQKPEDRFHRKAKLIEIIDGDTLDIQIDLGWSMTLKERVRLSEVDTPEIRNTLENKAGKYVTQKVQDYFLEGEELIITSKAYDRTGKVRGKYGRTIAEVYKLREGESLNSYLLSKKLGWPADEKGKIVGERDLARLTGIPKKYRA